jgi:hypothetical protein
MRKRGVILSAWRTLAIPAMCLVACGGGGSASPGAATTLRWTPPQFYTDNAPLVPATELQRFEIYVRQDLSFAEADVPVASAPSSATSYDLGTLASSLSRGVTYYASVRAVTAEGEKSDFSTAASFSFPP